MLNPCPAGQQTAGRIVHTMEEFPHVGRHIHQIHIQLGGAADELELFKGAGEGRSQHELIGGCAVPVYRIPVKGQPFLRNMDMTDVAPVRLLHQRGFHLPDDAPGDVGKTAAPFVHIFPDLKRAAGGSRRLGIQHRRNIDVPDEILQQRLQLAGVMDTRPGQGPELAGNPILRVAKFQRACHQFP